MNLNEVLSCFREYEEPSGRLSVLFVFKSGSRYKSYKPQVSNEVQTKILGLFKGNLESKIQSGIREVTFNPSGQETDEYSCCASDYVGNYEEVINLYDNTLTEELKPGQISFLIYRLRINPEGQDTQYLYAFRKNYKLKSIRKGFWMRKVSETYNVLDNELIGVDGGIDAISYNGELAFFSHIAAERIFNLREKFTENAKAVLQQVQTGSTIENFEEFKEDCLDDARILRRLTKIHSNPEIIQLFHQHFNNAPEVVELFDLNITFNDDRTKIVYSSKDELTDITMLMRDAYYRTVLMNRKGINDFN